MPKASQNSKIEYFNAQKQSILKTSDRIQEDYSSNSYSSVKPKNFDVLIDFNSLEIKVEEKPLSFVNKDNFLKQRKKIVHTLKALVTKHSLQLQTLFLAVAYFDLICSRMASFNELKRISKVCLILAAKFADDGSKAYQLEEAYRSELSSHYQSDEMFIVKLLNYNLNLFTAYDFLSQLLMCGVIFNNETNDMRKVDFMYNTVMKIALLFIESNSYIELSQSQMAFGIVAFSRELLGLEAFCPQIILKYNIQHKEHLYLEGIRVIQETFKVNHTKEKRKPTNSDKKDSNITKGINETYFSNKQYSKIASVC